MKPTKPQQAALATAYQCAMDICILDMKAPLRYINQYLAENISGFGTAADEKVRTREDCRKMIMDSRRQSKHLPFQAKKITPYRPKFIDETTACFHDEVLVQIGDKKNLHSLHLWFTTVFTYKHPLWQMVLFHGSMPDAHSSSDDTFHRHEAEKKLKEMEQLVALRTQELQNKNRELELESALEKVRTIAMGMKKAEDMLLICQTICKQLQLLDVQEIRNVQTAIFDEKGTYMNYEYYAKHKKSFVTEVAYRGKKVHQAQQSFVRTMMEKGGAFFTKSFRGQQMKDWYAYQKSTTQLADKFILKAHSLNYYWFSLGQVALGISTYYPLQKEQIELFTRFENVFGLAYRRYLDIEKAEAQAREAQVEAALERVRSRSMAMQKSKELHEVIQVVYDQLVHLHFPIEHAGFIVDYKTRNDFCSWIADKFGTPAQVTIPYFPCLYYNRFNEAKKKGIDFFATTLGLKEKNSFYKELFQRIPGIPAASKKFIYSQPGVTISTVLMENIALYMENFSGTPYSNEENRILIRFGKVFQQTYTRFLDLQKAETQAKEAQIEAALEKVRTAALTIRKSDEMLGIAQSLFEQLLELGFDNIRNAIIDLHNEKEETFFDYDYSHEMGGTITLMSFYEDAIIEKQVRQIESAPDAFFELILQGEDLQYLIDMRIRNGEKEDPRLNNTEQLTYNLYSFGNGAIGISNFGLLSDEHKQVLKRFRNVFAFAYKRYADLVLAETQAREAQIEAALERIRSRSLAMQKPSEIGEIIYQLYGELIKLDAQLDRCFIMTVNPQNNGITWWMAGAEGLLAENGFFVPMNQYASHLMYLDNWKQRKKKWQYLLKGKEKRDFDRFAFSKTELSQLPPFVKADMAAVKQVHLSGSAEQFGLLVTGSMVPLQEEQQEIIRRFTISFNQSYIRYLDIEKAEAQAREAQIEAALERVRARTMAMHKSEELAETASVLFHEFKKLFAGKILQVTIGIYNEQSQTIEFSSTNWQQDGAGFDKSITLSMKEPTLLKPMVTAWRQGKASHVVELTGKKLEGWLRYRNKMTGSTVTSKDTNGRRVITSAFFSSGHLSISSPEPKSPEAIILLERFALVFNQTYTRFLDLQKAEAQAKEAQIEAALERVRASAMAMHNSAGMLEVTQVLREQIARLGEKELESILIHIYHKETNEFEAWYSFRLPEDTEKKVKHGTVKVSWIKTARARKDKQKYYSNESDYTIVANKAMLSEWYAYLLQVVPEVVELDADGEMLVPDVLYYNYSKIAGGALLLITSSEASEPSKNLLSRAAKVFNLAYARYLDLQKAEAQAKEALIEAGLERVRSRTLAMHNSQELPDTAAVMFRQLIQLGIAPNRLYIGIVNEHTGVAEFWISDEDGTKVSMAYSANLHHNPTFQKMLEGWQQAKSSLVLDLQGATLKNYFKHLTQLGVPFRGGLHQKRRLQYLAYFSKGFIGLAAPDEQPASTLEVLERFAAVFNLTFTRFNDLKLAEAQSLQAAQDLIAIKEAKQKAEQALLNLQAAQTQLIQSEKMASLGELTAGIAHEIQNPLNFVNNFSEVSKELLDEMKEAILHGHAEEIKTIANDVIQNLEKIAFHGKRADAIVKGMLQHSRTSTGQKEATDINALCDEYMRLAYHGLRAKDKAFNAKFETSFDPSVPIIPIVQQEIGRVILNLINNAFYAVNERKKLAGPQYEPTVHITTQRVNNQVHISVADNGQGIPSSIKEKIFQPFFTTKPTGQGTGLGLSLAYDIVKAHGGEIKVQTADGEGTEFQIMLPAL